jgi:MSHA biogenesis protein MshQ
MLPVGGGAAVPLDFDGQARSILVVNYADAGKLRLVATYAGTGDEAGLTMLGSSPEFVVSPHHLRVRATTDGTTLLNNENPIGNPHWLAGEDFQVEVAGVCSNGSVTPNFAASTTLSATTGNPAAGTFTGGPLAAADYINGVVSGTAAYSEVGTVTLQAHQRVGPAQ